MAEDAAEIDSGESPGDAAGQATAVGGFSESVRLLEFDQIRQKLASYTRTVMGREAALSLTPSADPLEIAGRLQETMEARQFLDDGGGLEFGPDVDFREYVQRALLGGLLRGEEFCEIQALVAAARHDRTSLSRHESFPALSGVGGNLPDLGALAQAVGSAISPAGEVLDGASPALGQLRREARSAHGRLNEVMERNLRRLQRQEVIQEPIVTQRNGRLVLLIRAEMRSRVPGIVHDVSDSGATVFVEPLPAIDLGNRWRENRLAAEREEERILRNLSDAVSRAGEDLLLTLDLLARLDLDVAKGRYSAMVKGVAPSVSSQPGQSGLARRLRLIRARHPLLPAAVVPVSLELGGEHGVMLITGPNAGGKTVTLKTVGLLALMAQAGLHVPADEAQFPLCDGVYADIGDQQSIEHSLSTFSSHIQNILSIIQRVTVDSLVLLDELGTSTDPEEGSALAGAILSHFRDLGVLLVATTHHRGVARHVQEQSGMINASVDLHPQTLEPTYEVTRGLPGRSYALTIAARLGLPDDIIDQARASLSPEARTTEDLLSEIQEERRVIDVLRRDAETALLLARQQQAEVESELASVENSKVELVEEARQGLQDRIGDLLARLQEAERALDRPATPKVLQQERARLTEARRQISSPRWEPVEVRRVPWWERIKSGDRVHVRGIARAVEVITPPDEQGQVEVLVGTMRAKIPLYQLERQAEGHQAAAQHQVFFRRPTGRRAATEIDVRGLRADEAVAQVEGSLNDAALESLRSIRIIHGKGTGALRLAVRNYLHGHPLVAAAASAEGPGRDGVIVVELK